MSNITIRNIPDSVFEKIKLLSEIDKRSINNEMLIVLEKGVHQLESQNKQYGVPLNRNAQISIWKKLCGKWQDKRATKEIIKDIYGSRSQGREFKL